ncbi:MAG: endonuclease/exonuclease/phosphatase family protein [Chloroflexota bacterium]
MFRINRTTNRPLRGTPWGKRLLILLLTLYPALLVVLSLVNTLQPRRTGLLALTEVFAPYLFMPLLLIAPFALMRKAWLLRVALLVCVVLFCVRFPPKLVASVPQATPGAIQLSAMHWNVMLGGNYDKMIEVLRTKPASIVSMVEADWIRLSTDYEVGALYPYRFGDEKSGPVSGQALLSTYPIIEEGVLDEMPGLWGAPRVIWARLDVGLGRNVIVVVAHPPPGRFCGRSTFPNRCYDTTLRDKRLAAINAFVQPFVKSGDSLLLLGDFNVTEREPAYTDLSAGLVDSQLSAGTDTGLTWRPASLMDKNLAILRIDYMFSSPNVLPLATSVDCTPRGSDHCIVHGRFEVP